MKNGILACALMLLLSACQQPIVYIFSKGLSDIQRQQLEVALKTQSLPYEYVEHDIPREFGVATLLLSNDRILRQETEQLATIMQELGSVDLCRLKFVQTRGDLIAARGL